MKKINFLWISAAFVAGSVFGIALLGLVSFTGPSTPPGPTPAVNKINVADAKKFYQKFMHTAPNPDTSRIGGFAIDRETISAMSNVLKDVPSLSAFRIYMGVDGSGNKITMVIGADASGSEMSTSVWTAAMGAKVGPCPPICDIHSPISGH